MRRRIRIRRNDGLYVSHTLTLGQALMPAGLSVEGRFMCHACGPRRAWLKHSYIPPLAADPTAQPQACNGFGAREPHRFPAGFGASAPFSCQITKSGSLIQS